MSCPPTSSRPIEPYAEREIQTSCDPIAKPGVLRFREYVMTRFGGGDVGIIRECNLSRPSEHQEGRAWDWGLVPGAHIGDGVAVWPADVEGFLEWLLCRDDLGNEHANARRAGVMYLIHDRRIWRAYDKPGQPRGSWYPYQGPDPHTTHIHLSFGRAGANAETSLYDGLKGADGGPVA